MSLRMRRGSRPTSPPPDPPPGDVIGPTLGAQSVRDGAGARSVTIPGGATTFTSPADLQTKMNANPTGTFVAAGNMNWTFTLSASLGSTVYIPNGVVINGNGFTSTALVIRDGCQLHGGIWQNYQGEPAPVTCQGTGAAKLVQDATFNNNFGWGFRNFGFNTTVDHCTFHTNGRYGWGSSDPGVGQGVLQNCKFEYLEWYNNNTRLLNPAGDAGGTKILYTLDSQVRFCWAHDNNGSGLWYDFSPGSHIVEENVFENNDNWGIHYEVGTGDPAQSGTATADIHNNYLKDNGLGSATWPNPPGDWFNGVQLLASCSDGLRNGGTGHEIHHNYIDGTTARHMGFMDHPVHPTDQKGAHFHDNDVWIRSTTTNVIGGAWDVATGNDPYSVASNNTFENNHYHVQNTGVAHWRWNNGNRTWSQWQAFGNDNTGSLETI